MSPPGSGHTNYPIRRPFAFCSGRPAYTNGGNSNAGTGSDEPQRCHYHAGGERRAGGAAAEPPRAGRASGCAADGTLAGIVTDRDIVTRCVAAGEEPGRVPVRDIMSPAPSVITPETPISDAARLMAQRQVRRLPVVEQGHVVGMLSLGDLARSRRTDTEAAEALSDISASLRRKKR